MGIPYSRQINAAFEQVTPLVAAGFTVLRTTRDISILLAIIQVLTVVLLALILGVLVLIVYCVNPDLEVTSFSLFLFTLIFFFFFTLQRKEGGWGRQGNGRRRRRRRGRRRRRRRRRRKEGDRKGVGADEMVKQEERQRIITPWLRYAARISIWGVIKFVVGLAVICSAASAAVWKGIVAKQWVEDVEYEGNVRAEMALEELDEERGDDEGGKKVGSRKGKKK